MIKWHYEKKDGCYNIYEEGCSHYDSGWICSCYGVKAEERAKEIVDAHNTVVKECLTTEYTCPSCGKPLHFYYKGMGDYDSTVPVCSFCGYEIPQSLIDEMIEQAR